MVIRLQRLPELQAPHDPDYKDTLPQRFRLMQPDAAEALLALEHNAGLIYTDMYRMPLQQLDAYRRKAGTQPVGYSAHDFGFAFDIDVHETLLKLKMRYPELVEYVGEYGFYCHRRDLDPTASESWHFNYLGQDGDTEGYLALADPQNHITWSAPVEAKIQERYAKDFVLDAMGVQAALIAADCKNIVEFQMAWDLAADGIAGPKTQRVLAYVTAQVNIKELDIG